MIGRLIAQLIIQLIVWLIVIDRETAFSEILEIPKSPYETTSRGKWQQK